MKQVKARVFLNFGVCSDIDEGLLNYLSVFRVHKHFNAEQTQQFDKYDKKLDKLRDQHAPFLGNNAMFTLCLTLRKKYLQLLQYKNFSVLKKKKPCLFSHGLSF